MDDKIIKEKSISLMKDEKFIEWKLFPNDKINQYWEKHLKENPQKRDVFELASNSFPKVNLTYGNVSDEKKEHVINKISESLQKDRKRKGLSTIIFTIAAIFIGVIVFSTLFYDKKVNDDYITITGKEIEALDIQLTSNNIIKTFQENIEIEMDDLGEMKITNSEGNNIENSSIIEKRSTNTLVIPFGKRSTIVLADGSKVWLNSGTILEFPSSFTAYSRTISLKSGEIYVEVAKDSKKPFYVNTPDFNIKVYGTKFNVSSYEGKKPAALLAEGSIAIQKEGYKELLMKPSELVEITEDNTFVRQRVDIDKYISWKSGYLLFNNSPITEVLQELEKYYNLSFNLDNQDYFKDNTCKGKILLSENLDNVLATLSVLTGTEYQREENKIYIKSKKK